MKPADIEKQFKKFLTEINKEAAECIKKAKAAKTTSVILYQDRYRFFEIKKDSAEFDQGDSAESIIETIKAFDEDIQSHKDELDFSYGFEAEGTGYADDSSVEFAGMKASWYVPREKDCERFKNMAKENTKAWVAEKIRDHKDVKRGIGIFIDCKILELFKTEAIDFDTLCTITLSNCKL